MAKRAKYVLYDPGDKVDVAAKEDIPPPRDLVEQMYCSEQIHIPPTFPYILRQYCKAAIRTQPYDLLKWSTAYFRAMAEGEVPPVKQRLEYPPTDVPSGLTPGYLRVILRQLKRKKVVPTELLIYKWGGLCLNQNALDVMLQIGEFTEDEVDVLKFVAIAAGHLTNTLKQTMIVICEILTEEPEGGSAMIPFSTFCDLYTFLAKMDCGPPSAHEPDAEVTLEEHEGEEEKEDDKIEAKLHTQPSSEAYATDIVSDIVEHVITISPGEEETPYDDEETPETVAEADDQEGGEQELSPQPPETPISEELGSSSKESDLEQEDKEDTLEDTAVHEGKDQVSETTKETGTINMHPHKQGSEANVDRTTSVKFFIPAEAEKDVSKDVSLMSEESGSAVSDVMSSEMIAKETTQELVHRAELAAEVSRAEITAAQFLVKVKSETQSKKSRVQTPSHKKTPKAPHVHHEVPGIGPPVSEEQIDKVITYLHYWSARQEGMIMPRNINHFLCPPLDPPPPPEFLESSQATCTCGVGDPMATDCRCTTASDK